MATSAAKSELLSTQFAKNSMMGCNSTSCYAHPRQHVPFFFQHKPLWQLSAVVSAVCRPLDAVLPELRLLPEDCKDTSWWMPISSWSEPQSLLHPQQIVGRPEGSTSSSFAGLEGIPKTNQKTVVLDEAWSVLSSKPWCCLMLRKS